MKKKKIFHMYCILITYKCISIEVSNIVSTSLGSPIRYIFKIYVSCIKLNFFSCLFLQVNFNYKGELISKYLHIIFSKVYRYSYFIQSKIGLILHYHLHISMLFLPKFSQFSPRFVYLVIFFKD